MSRFLPEFHVPKPYDIAYFCLSLSRHNDSSIPGQLFIEWTFAYAWFRICSIVERKNCMLQERRIIDLFLWYNSQNLVKLTGLPEYVEARPKLSRKRKRGQISRGPTPVVVSGNESDLDGTEEAPFYGDGCFENSWHSTLAALGCAVPVFFACYAVSVASLVEFLAVCFMFAMFCVSLRLFVFRE